MNELGRRNGGTIHRGATLTSPSLGSERRYILGTSGVPSRGGWGFKPPEIPKALQNRAKLNPIVKTVKNCWI